MMRNKPRDADVYGVDIGKNIFHIVGVDAAGTPIQRVRCRRETLIQFFQRAAPAVVGMEACPGSQWLARKISVIRSYGEDRPCAVREAISEVEQERHARR